MGHNYDKPMYSNKLKEIFTNHRTIKPIYFISDHHFQRNISKFYKNFNQQYFEKNFNFLRKIIYINLEYFPMAFMNSETCSRRSKQFNLLTTMLNHFHDHNDYCTSASSNVYASSLYYTGQNATVNATILILTRITSFKIIKNSDSDNNSGFKEYVLMLILANFLTNYRSDFMSNKKNIIFQIIENDPIETLTNNTNKSFGFPNMESQNVIKVIDLSLIDLQKSNNLKYIQIKNISSPNSSCSNYLTEYLRINKNPLLDSNDIDIVTNKPFNFSCSNFISKEFVFNDSKTQKHTSIAFNSSVSIIKDFIMEFSYRISSILGLNLTLNRSDFNKELFSLLNCSSFLNCSNASKIFPMTENESILSSSLKFILREKVSVNNETCKPSRTQTHDNRFYFQRNNDCFAVAFFHMTQMGQHENWMVSNEYKSSKFKIFLDSNFKHVTLIIGTYVFLFSILIVYKSETILVYLKCMDDRIK